MKLLILSSIACYAASFLLATDNLSNGSSVSKSMLSRIRHAAKHATCRNEKLKLLYQNPTDVTYYASNLKTLKNRSKKKSSSKIKSHLATGHAVVIQLRDRATIVENDTIYEIEKKIYTQKLKDGLLRLKTALYVARDTDLKMGLHDTQESLKVWNEIDKIYNIMELQSVNGREINVEDIIAVCNELEKTFKNIH